MNGSLKVQLQKARADLNETQAGMDQTAAEAMEAGIRVASTGLLAAEEANAALALELSQVEARLATQVSRVAELLARATAAENKSAASAAGAAAAEQRMVMLQQKMKGFAAREVYTI